YGYIHTARSSPPWCFRSPTPSPKNPYFVKKAFSIDCLRIPVLTSLPFPYFIFLGSPIEKSFNSISLLIAIVICTHFLSHFYIKAPDCLTKYAQILSPKMRPIVED